MLCRRGRHQAISRQPGSPPQPPGVAPRRWSSKRCSAPLRGKEPLVSEQTATISTSFPAAKPPPAAARTRQLLEAPIFSTLLKLSAPNVLNLLAFAGMVTFDGF